MQEILLSDMFSLAILLQNTTLFGIELIDPGSFAEFIFRFSLNFLVTVIIVRYTYFARSRRKDYLFTFFIISITVFFLSYLLESVKLQLGFALGLFALFGIIRYRTSSIPIKEMTYLFLIICISVINALAGDGISYADLAFTNLAIIFSAKALEYFWFYNYESSKTIIYEKIDLIKPQYQKQFIEDLERRTGLQINRVEIGEIDFKKDIAEITIYYKYDPNSTNFFEGVEAEIHDLENASDVKKNNQKS